MTLPPTTARAGASARGGAASRSARGRSGARSRAAQRARRRRWWAFAVLVVALAGVGIWVVNTPLGQKAVNEFGLPLRYSATIRQQAAQKRLDPALVAAVIYAETKFEPRTSPMGAVGPMQMEPQTALELAHRSGGTSFQVSDLAHPSVNIAYGTYYLRLLLNEFHGSAVLALAAYNGGETNVSRWAAEADQRGRPMRISDIPFPETRAYVKKVLTARGEYRHKYAHQLGYG